jgi:protein SCO1/2
VRGPGLLLSLLLLSGAASADPPLKAAGVTEHLGARVPLELTLTDSDGARVSLGRAFRAGRPVLLTLVYYRCPMLCDLLLDGLTEGLRETGLRLGTDYAAVTLSIDPSESHGLALVRKRGHLQALGRTEADPDWLFTVGSAAEIQALAESVGFGYVQDSASKQFAHSPVVVVLSPEGRISRYLYGVKTAPATLRSSLEQAGRGKVETSREVSLLTCFRGLGRRNTLAALVLTRTGAVLTFVFLVGLIFRLARREARRKSTEQVWRL